MPLNSTDISFPTISGRHVLPVFELMNDLIPLNHPDNLSNTLNSSIHDKTTCIKHALDKQELMNIQSDIERYSKEAALAKGSFLWKPDKNTINKSYNDIHNDTNNRTHNDSHVSKLISNISNTLDKSLTEYNAFLSTGSNVGKRQRNENVLQPLLQPALSIVTPKRQINAEKFKTPAYITQDTDKYNHTTDYNETMDAIPCTDGDIEEQIPKLFIFETTWNSIKFNNLFCKLSTLTKDDWLRPTKQCPFTFNILYILDKYFKNEPLTLPTISTLDSIKINYNIIIINILERICLIHKPLIKVSDNSKLMRLQERLIKLSILLHIVASLIIIDSEFCIAFHQDKIEDVFYIIKKYITVFNIEYQLKSDLNMYIQHLKVISDILSTFYSILQSIFTFNPTLKFISKGTLNKYTSTELCLVDTLLYSMLDCIFSYINMLNTVNCKNETTNLNNEFRTALTLCRLILSNTSIHLLDLVIYNSFNMILSYNIDYLTFPYILVEGQICNQASTLCKVGTLSLIFIMIIQSYLYVLFTAFLCSDVKEIPTKSIKKGKNHRKVYDSLLSKIKTMVQYIVVIILNHCLFLDSTVNTKIASFNQLVIDMFVFIFSLCPYSAIATIILSCYKEIIITLYYYTKSMLCDTTYCQQVSATKATLTKEVFLKILKLISEAQNKKKCQFLQIFINIIGMITYQLIHFKSGIVNDSIVINQDIKSSTALFIEQFTNKDHASDLNSHSNTLIDNLDISNMLQQAIFTYSSLYLKSDSKHSNSNLSCPLYASIFHFILLIDIKSQNNLFNHVQHYLPNKLSYWLHTDACMQVYSQATVSDLHTYSQALSKYIINTKELQPDNIHVLSVHPLLSFKYEELLIHFLFICLHRDTKHSQDTYTELIHKEAYRQVSQLIKISSKITEITWNYMSGMNLQSLDIKFKYMFISLLFLSIEPHTDAYMHSIVNDDTELLIHNFLIYLPYLHRMFYFLFELIESASLAVLDKAMESLNSFIHSKLINIYYFHLLCYYHDVNGEVFKVLPSQNPHQFFTQFICMIQLKLFKIYCSQSLRLGPSKEKFIQIFLDLICMPGLKTYINRSKFNFTKPFQLLDIKTYFFTTLISQLITSNYTPLSQLKDCPIHYILYDILLSFNISPQSKDCKLYIDLSEDGFIECLIRISLSALFDSLDNALDTPVLELSHYSYFINDSNTDSPIKYEIYPFTSNLTPYTQSISAFLEFISFSFPSKFSSFQELFNTLLSSLISISLSPQTSSSHQIKVIILLHLLRIVKNCTPFISEFISLKNVENLLLLSVKSTGSYKIPIVSTIGHILTSMTTCKSDMLPVNQLFKILVPQLTKVECNQHNIIYSYMEYYHTKASITHYTRTKEKKILLKFLNQLYHRFSNTLEGLSIISKKQILNDASITISKSTYQAINLLYSICYLYKSNFFHNTQLTLHIQAINTHPLPNYFISKSRETSTNISQCSTNQCSIFIEKLLIILKKLLGKISLDVHIDLNNYSITCDSNFESYLCDMFSLNLYHYVNLHLLILSPYLEVINSLYQYQYISFTSFKENCHWLISYLFGHMNYLHMELVNVRIYKNLMNMHGLIKNIQILLSKVLNIIFQFLKHQQDSIKNTLLIQKYKFDTLQDSTFTDYREVNDIAVKEGSNGCLNAQTGLEMQLLYSIIPLIYKIISGKYLYNPTLYKDAMDIVKLSFQIGISVVSLLEPLVASLPLIIHSFVCLYNKEFNHKDVKSVQLSEFMYKYLSITSNNCHLISHIFELVHSSISNTMLTSGETTVVTTVASGLFKAFINLLRQYGIVKYTHDINPNREAPYLSLYTYMLFLPSLQIQSVPPHYLTSSLTSVFLSLCTFKSPVPKAQQNKQFDIFIKIAEKSLLNSLEEEYILRLFFDNVPCVPLKFKFDVALQSNKLIQDHYAIFSMKETCILFPNSSAISDLFQYYTYIYTIKYHGCLPIIYVIHSLAYLPYHECMLNEFEISANYILNHMYMTLMQSGYIQLPCLYAIDKIISLLVTFIGQHIEVCTQFLENEFKMVSNGQKGTKHKALLPIHMDQIEYWLNSYIQAFTLVSLIIFKNYMVKLQIFLRQVNFNASELHAIKRYLLVNTYFIQALWAKIMDVNAIYPEYDSDITDNDANLTFIQNLFKRSTIPQASLALSKLLAMIEEYRHSAYVASKNTKKRKARVTKRSTSDTTSTDLSD